MSSSTSTSPIVLVTGANGFVGAHVTLAFLKAGWRVRGTTRSQDKADAMKALPAFKEHSPNLEFALISDIETRSALLPSVLLLL